MVAAANSDYGSAVSHQTHSVEGQAVDGQVLGKAKRAGGAKKSALGVFAKLLAGLTRKTGTGGEDAGEIGTEGLKEAEKTARGLKNASGTKAGTPGERIPVPNNEKIQNRDQRFLAVLKGEGEVPDPEAAAQEGPVKKSRRAQKNPGGEEAVPLAAAELASGALPPEASPLEGPGNDGAPGAADQEGLFRLAGTEGPEAAAGEPSPRGRRGEGPGLAADAEPGAEIAAGAETAAAALRHERGAIREEPGTAKKEKAAGAGNSRKNRERFALEVQDIRTEGAANGAAPGAAQALQNGAEAGAERTVDLAVDLQSDRLNRESAQSGRPKTAGAAFEDILARELHQNLNGDIVRQASILVKDGGEGTIKLSLKPESLGMVKVRLEMAENKITGRIIVESNEALRAFEREIHSLEQAFRDSGFAGASLEMALAGDGGQNGRGRWDGDGARTLFSSRAVSSNYDAMGETMDVVAAEAGLDGFAGPGVSRVNVWA